MENAKLIIEMVLISGSLGLGYFFMRSNSAARLLVELLTLILALTLIAMTFKLYLVMAFMGFLVMVLVVVFQVELRHIFVRLMGHQLLASEVNRDLIEDLGETASQLSAKRYGALFAIERGMDLKQYLETGVVLDSKFSAELAMTIFHPKTTLHDGGMILSQGRIEGAGCVFPVSQRELSDRSIGLRHRAAIGITEQTDAIAIVVSEETGSISIAHRGFIEGGLDAEQLKKRLAELLTKEKEKEEKTREPRERERGREGEGIKNSTERTATKRLEA